MQFSGVPSTTRGFEAHAFAARSSSMTEPIGNDFDTLAIKYRIWLSCQTQPRMEVGELALTGVNLPEELGQVEFGRSESAA